MKCFFCWYIYVRSRPTRNSDESRSKFKFISNDICMKIERVAQEWRKNAPTIDPATRQTDQAKWVEHLNNLIEYDFCAFAPANPIHSINFDQISDFDAHVLDCKWEKINGTIKKLKWSSIHIFFLHWIDHKGDDPIRSHILFKNMKIDRKKKHSRCQKKCYWPTAGENAFYFRALLSAPKIIKLEYLEILSSI